VTIKTTSSRTNSLNLCSGYTIIRVHRRSRNTVDPLGIAMLIPSICPEELNEGCMCDFMEDASFPMLDSFPIADPIEGSSSTSLSVCMRRYPTGTEKESLLRRDSKIVLQKLDVFLANGTLVHNCNRKSFGSPVSHAISCRGTCAIRVIPVTRALMSASILYRNASMRPWAKQSTKLNRKNPKDILLSVIRRYADFRLIDTMIERAGS